MLRCLINESFSFIIKSVVLFWILSVFINNCDVRLIFDLKLSCQHIFPLLLFLVNVRQDVKHHEDESV